MSEWPITQLRRVARLAYGGTLPAELRQEGVVPVFGSNGPLGRHSAANTHGPVIVIGRKGSHGKLQYSDCPVFAIDTTYFIDGRSTSTSLRWLYYALATLGLEGLSHDVGVPGLSREAAHTQLLAVPSETEQEVIADFLDAETARVDCLVEARRRHLALLRERRQAVLLQGVSGQLTGRGDRVPSRAHWLVDRPARWAEVQVRLVARLGSGHTPSRSRPEWWGIDECTIPWVTTGEVASLRDDAVEYITETRERISLAGLANSAAEVHPAGTVVLSRTASVGFSGIMASDMATSQDFATWTCGPRLRSRFLLLCLRAMRPDLLGRLAMGSTHKTIYMPDLATIRIPLPSTDEQDRVVDLVWQELEAIRRTEDALGQQIDLLRERRQALITAAVTGQVDVTKGAT